MRIDKGQWSIEVRPFTDENRHEESCLFVLSRGWAKENVLSTFEELNLRDSDSALIMFQAFCILLGWSILGSESNKETNNLFGLDRGIGSLHLIVGGNVARNFASLALVTFPTVRYTSTCVRLA